MTDTRIEDLKTVEPDGSLTEDRLEEILDERFDVEALAEMVEHLDFSHRLSQKLTNAFREVRTRSVRNRNVLESVEREIRDLILDVALLKRAVASLGQVGVLQRRKIEKELIRELFPPSQPRQGTGLIISPLNQPQTKRVDCENRLHLCKAACCRIFNVGLTPQEVESDRFDWDPRRPYALQKNRQGCVHLQGGGCACSIYNNRPRICQTYSCEKDSRIWADFENKVINPELKKQLDTLDVATAATYSTKSMSENGSSINFPTIETGRSNGHAQNGDPLLAAMINQPAEGQHETGIIANDEHGKEISKHVAPPNFDDLRALMVPLPEEKFVPPLKDDKMS
jgi:Fe-S-cluster containining protein